MILVDDRTGSAELAPLLHSPTIVCRLPFSDFSWSGNGPEGPVSIGVERKRIHDFLSSMISGRLSGHQLIGLTREYDWVYLVVEGVWRPDRRNGTLVVPGHGGGWRPLSHGSRRFMARDVYRFLNSLVVCCGVITVSTSNDWETARWLDACHGWWEKSWDRHSSHLQFQATEYAQLSKPSLVARVAAQLDGIGWTKARVVSSAFPSLPDLMHASVDDLMELDGVGPVLAKSIWEQLHGT